MDLGVSHDVETALDYIHRADVDVDAEHVLYIDLYWNLFRFIAVE